MVTEVGDVVRFWAHEEGGAMRYASGITVEGQRRKRTNSQGGSKVWGLRIWKDGDGTPRGRAGFRGRPGAQLGHAKGPQTLQACYVA